MEFIYFIVVCILLFVIVVLRKRKRVNNKAIIKTTENFKEVIPAKVVINQKIIVPVTENKEVEPITSKNKWLNPTDNFCKL
jgi:hypothetical protein